MTAALRHTLDTLLIIVPLIVMTYFLFDPAAFDRGCFWRSMSVQDSDRAPTVREIAAGRQPPSASATEPGRNAHRDP
jgi:hypothetical protein